MLDNPNKVVNIWLSSPNHFTVQFADGTTFTQSVDVFGMPVELLEWDTITVANNGNAIVVTDIVGEPLEIDHKTVRFFVDPIYAKQVTERHNKNRLTRAELQELATASKNRPIINEKESDFYRPGFAPQDRK